MSDARIGAFIGAWDRMKAAGQFRHDFRERQPCIDIAYPPDYYALIAEAQVFATLSGADTLTGLLVGDVLEEREKQDDIRLARNARAVQDFLAPEKDADDGET